MKTTAQARSILHVDLDSFFVSVERSLDPGLRGKPLVIGGDPGAEGSVAAASAEARARGVFAGQSLAAARNLCPDAVFRAGDLDAYARTSDEVTAVLLAASRRVERPSIDEAFVDLATDLSTSPVQQAEGLKDEFHRRMGLDASFGLAQTRLAARVASGRARPRGLLIVLPGYEQSFLANQPICVLPELPPHVERALLKHQIQTLGDLTRVDEKALSSIVGRATAQRLQETALAKAEPPIDVAAPPSWIQEEAQVRDRRSDAEALESLLHGLVTRACRRLRPFELSVGALTVEVTRGGNVERRVETLQPATNDEATLRMVAGGLAGPLFEPAGSVRRISLRLARLEKPTQQAPLFPIPGSAGRRAGLL